MRNLQSAGLSHPETRVTEVPTKASPAWEQEGRQTEKQAIDGEFVDGGTKTGDNDAAGLRLVEEVVSPDLKFVDLDTITNSECSDY